VAEQGNLHYLVMEYLRGRLLRDAMRDDRQLPFSHMLHILEQRAEALDFAHSQRVSHHDVKPANVFLDASDHVTLVDVGIARAADGTHPTITQRHRHPRVRRPIATRATNCTPC
jgi:eukaryotic-like serine/threonine-protein kinase